jgi:ubiquinone biosynthesis monooxygenase Coq7
MRVNHVGEVCAQALYQAQALTARTPELRQRMQAAARDELDHLAWTETRLDELGDRASLLNPLWYAGSFAIGLLAGRLGDAASLGFVVETERQVEQHLAGHLDRLPAADLRSRAIVDHMRDDERRHADDALDAGGQELPAPVRWLMRGAACHDDHRPSRLTAHGRARSGRHDLVAGGDGGGLGQHDAGRAVALVRQRDGPLHRRGRQVLAAHVKCMWMAVKTLGSVAARSASP